MASMNTRLNIEKLDGNIVQKHGGSKQVGFKQLGPGVETGVHGVHDEKRVWFEVELQGAQGDREAEVFQVSNDDTAVAQRRLEDKQPEEKTNTDCLVKEQEKEYQTGWKIKTGNVLDSCNQRSTQQCITSESGLSKVLGRGYKNQMFFHIVMNKSPSSATMDLYDAHKDMYMGNKPLEVRWTLLIIGAQQRSHKKCSDDSDGYYLSLTQSGNTLRVSQSRIHNKKLVQTLLEGHSIMSLEDSLSGDCDVEKNGKWSIIRMRLESRSTMAARDLTIHLQMWVMLDNCNRGLQQLQFLWILTNAMGNHHKVLLEEGNMAKEDFCRVIYEQIISSN
ncbi:hypothetical protein Tco_0436194, partial [Tanacetum coccineum]